VRLRGRSTAGTLDWCGSGKKCMKLASIEELYVEDRSRLSHGGCLMIASPMQGVVHQLRPPPLVHDGPGLTGSQLLPLFVERRDEAAFESLLRRHGPMVMGVCRRVLRNPHDAEDAFQASFLVLVRKAARIVPRDMVANWLYGVARTTALRANAL